MSFTEARSRKVVESSLPAVQGTSYAAAAVGMSASNIAIQIDLTWFSGEDKYKKIWDIGFFFFFKLQKQIN